MKAVFDYTGMLIIKDKVYCEALYGTNAPIHFRVITQSEVSVLCIGGVLYEICSRSK